MQICKEILDDILSNMPMTPPEAGGIIGGKGRKICIWEFDTGYEERGCVYRPNVDYLNKIIAMWLDEGYDFMGILHVHFGEAECLSEGDKRYIEKIVKSMPNSVRQLYFPIVVQPERKFVSYMATRNESGEVKIVSDEVKVI